MFSDAIYPQKQAKACFLSVKHCFLQCKALLYEADTARFAVPNHGFSGVFQTENDAQTAIIRHTTLTHRHLYLHTFSGHISVNRILISK